jgi:hypothetical protein
MNENLRNSIILKAWDLIQEDIRIKKIYFIPWLISIIFLTFLLVYQTVYTYVVLLDKKEEILVVLLELFHSEYILQLIIWLIIFYIIYTILLPIFEWWLIYYIDKKNKGEKVTGSEIIWWGLYKFLPFFEYTNLFSQFKFITTVNIYLFCLRFVWIEYIWFLNYAFWLLLILTTILNILFSYSRFEIILNDKKAIWAISQSMKICLFNLWITTKIYFFLFLVNIRVIINFFIFLLFPIIITAAIVYISSQIFLTITIGILTIIFIWLIVLLWYLGWVFEVFKISVWYYAYLEWKKKVKDDHDDHGHGGHDEHGGSHGQDDHSWWHGHDAHAGWWHWKDDHWHDSHAWHH